jgi:hypothetical protein
MMKKRYSLCLLAISFSFFSFSAFAQHVGAGLKTSDFGVRSSTIPNGLPQVPSPSSSDTSSGQDPLSPPVDPAQDQGQGQGQDMGDPKGNSSSAAQDSQ